MPLSLTAQEQALVGLGTFLRGHGYAFTTVTPETHRRVLVRGGIARSLADIFGWSKEFSSTALPPHAVDLLRQAGALETLSEGFRSRVRVSTLAGQFFVHSAFPTAEEDAVFFGPDTYRFVRLVQDRLQRIDRARFETLIDVGCGSGAGGIAVARGVGADSKARILLSDINDRALSMSRVNCALNDVKTAEAVSADVLDGLPSEVDLIISNPPYLVDAQKRTYRHGGGEFGFDLALRIAAGAIEHLKAGGSLILYTGTPVVEGRDLFRDAVSPMLASPNILASYEEIDPDVFGEELERAAYHCADRIAVVALTLTKT